MFPYQHPTNFYSRQCNFYKLAEKEKFSLKEFIYKIKPTERNFIFQNAC